MKNWLKIERIPGPLASSYEKATRLAIDHLRRERIKRRLFFFRQDNDAPDPVELAGDTRPDPGRTFQSQEAMRLLRKSLGRLSPRQRVIFTLRHYEGLPLKEIAEHLELETGTVKAHLHRARVVEARVGGEGGLEDVDRFPGLGIAAHEDVEGGVITFRPGVHTDVRFGKNSYAGNAAVGREVVQVNVQQRRPCGVDRTAELLPWHGAADVERLSPIDASARSMACQPTPSGIHSPDLRPR